MKTLKSNLQLIYLCLRGSKAWVICTSLNILINPIRNLTVDVLLIGAIYNMIEQGKTFETLVPFLLLLILFYLATTIFEGFLYAKIEPIGSIKIQRYIDRILCENAASVDIAMFDNAKFYEENIFSVENCTNIAKNAVRNTASFFAYLLGGLFSIGLIADIEPLMAGFIGLSILFSMLISNRQKKIGLAYNERRASLQTRERYIHRVFYGREYAKELRIYPQLVEMNLSLFSEVEKENSKLTKSFGKKNLVCGLLSVLNSRVLMYWTVMLLMVLIIRFRGDVEPGNLLIMTVSIATAALLIGAITGTIPEMANLRRYQEQFERFLSYSQKRREKMGKIAVSKIESICFDHVSFTYPGESRRILSDISFTAVPGDHLVIVGLNGSGKSTIIKLLMGFYPPDAGKILINGYDLQELDMDSYLSTVACVFQDVIPYALSVEKNITVAEEPFDPDKMQKVLEDTCLVDVFDAEMLQSEMTREFSPKGAVLSGGTMQKMTLARALYRNASMLVLDETTSAIDPESEIQIMDAVERIAKDRIVVQISHKLSCVQKGSKILYLENGQIVEVGSHQELLERKGKYYELFSYQAEKFKQETKKNKLREEAWT